MFDSLDDQMKHDAQAEASTKERMMKYLVICAVSFVAVGAMAAAYQFVR